MLPYVDRVHNWIRRTIPFWGDCKTEEGGPLFPMYSRFPLLTSHCLSLLLHNMEQCLLGIPLTEPTNLILDCLLFLE